ncbi:hypothetical protein PAHAL_1G346600 [Panicum hallii]|uniref:Uncharacterized protein n=1 Tax=Panicum hallii TaxID=206008 RepID=A0A2T8KX86_9POAL|nr:hypothetical protein PAHAL_1G346600 [Panicum hallii]
MVLEDGRAHCVVKERVEVPFGTDLASAGVCACLLGSCWPPPGGGGGGGGVGWGARAQGMGWHGRTLGT